MLIGAQKSGVLDVHIKVLSSSFLFNVQSNTLEQLNKTNKAFFWSGDSLEN